MYTIINVKQTCKYVFAYVFVDYTSSSANFTYYIEIGNVSNGALHIFIENCQNKIFSRTTDSLMHAATELQSTEHYTV